MFRAWLPALDINSVYRRAAQDGWKKRPSRRKAAKKNPYESYPHAPKGRNKKAQGVALVVPHNSQVVLANWGR
jgi:hypothetical protein